MAATDSDAWTFVKPRSRKNKQSGRGSALGHHPGEQTSAISPGTFKPRTSNLRSVDEIYDEYRSVRAEWLESESCTKLRELVRKHASKQPAVSKALCLGIGTFDPEDGAWAQKRISFHQLIAFTVMVEELGVFPVTPPAQHIVGDLRLTCQSRKVRQIYDQKHFARPYLH